MKKFILFLFLVNVISISSSVSAQAQDSDEFMDPSLQSSPVPAPSIESSAAEPTAPQNPSSTDDALKSSETTTETLTETPAAVTPNPADEQSVQSAPLDLNETSLSAEAQPMPEYTEENSAGSGDVIVESQADLTKSYRQRRGQHGVLFSINYEKFNPFDYYSQYRDAYISTDSVDLLGLELGYKYNFKLGSISILANGAYGKKTDCPFVDEDGNAKTPRDISITRYGVALNYAADNLMEEPWIVPYGQVGIHQFAVTEDDPNQKDASGQAIGAVSTTTQISLDYKFGLLFQLNWIEKSIDPDTHTEGLLSSGLQNTFLDFFVATHLASAQTYDPKDANSEGDPDLASSTEFGVGLKMEF